MSDAIMKDLNFNLKRRWQHLQGIVLSRFHTDMILEGAETIVFRPQKYLKLSYFVQCIEFLGLQNRDILSYTQTSWLYEIPTDHSSPPYFLWKCFMPWTDPEHRTPIHSDMTQEDNRKVESFFCKNAGDILKSFRCSSGGLSCILKERYAGHGIPLADIQRIVDLCGAHYVRLKATNHGSVSLELGAHIKVSWIISPELLIEEGS